MTIKQQYNSLDTSKLPKEVLFEVNEIKEDSQNFTNIPDFIEEDWKMLWNDVILKKYKSAIKSSSTSKKKETIEDTLLDSPEVRNKMPLHQQRILSHEHISTVKRLEKELKEIPKLYSQNGKPKNEIMVHAHYFVGNSDWFITEKNDINFYGYVILNGDSQMSEMGYINIEELRKNKSIELDFHWTKKSLAQALYEADKDYFPNPKEKTTTKKVTQTKEKTKPKTTPKKRVKKVNSIVDKEQVAHFSEEYKLIRRFWNTIQKEITFRKAQLLYWAFEKAIVSRKVRKTSDKADLFKKVNNKVVALFKLMEGDEIKVIKKLEIKDQNLHKEIENFVKGQKVDSAVRLLNRFIGLQGKDITKIQATRLLNAIDKAKIEKSNRLYDELQKARKELKTFLDTGKEPIEPSPQTLSGINKPLSESKKKIIAPSSEPVPVPFVDDNLFIQATQRETQKAPNTFRLKGEMGKFMQDLQRYRLTIAITGDPHAGKSEFVKQLVNSFLDEGMTCGFFDLEQGGIISKDTAQSIDRNITKENQKRLFVSGEAPNGIDTVKQFANQFDIVVIDSWQKLNIPNTRFDELRQEFPNTIFIIIFQQNGTGGTRGGVTVDYDTPIAIKVHKVDDKFVNNFAELIKNRGNTVGLKYNMSKYIRIFEHGE